MKKSLGYRYRKTVIVHKRSIAGSINLAPGSFNDRRELAIEVRDKDIITGLEKVAHHDWKHSKAMDLIDKRLFTDLESHGGGLERLVLRMDDEHEKNHNQK